MTANQAFKTWRSATGDEETTFKEWMAQQKANGNIDKAGKLIIDSIFSSNQAPTSPVEVQDKNADTELRVMGLTKKAWVTTAVVVVAIGVGFMAYRHYRNKQA